MTHFFYAFLHKYMKIQKLYLWRKKKNMAYITKDIDRLSGNLGIGATEKEKLLTTVKSLNAFLKREERIKSGDEIENSYDERNEEDIDFGDDYEIGE